MLRPTPLEIPIRLDPRVTREVPLKDRARLQFVFEAFNIFNRYNVTATPASSPNAVRNTLYALTGGQLVRQSNFGQILGSSNPRVIQFHLTGDGDIRWGKGVVVI